MQGDAIGDRFDVFVCNVKRLASLLKSTAALEQLSFPSNVTFNSTGQDTNLDVANVTVPFVGSTTAPIAQVVSFCQSSQILA